MLALLVAMLLLFTIPVGSSDNTRIVGTNSPQAHLRSSTLYVGPGQTYSTIGAAITAASSGDTIRVLNGTYYENLVIDKTLSLIGSGRAGTIIFGMDNVDIITIDAENCTVIGFTVTNDTDYNYGIRINGNHTTVSDCNCSDVYGGIFIKSDFNMISNCICNSNWYYMDIAGIIIYYSNNNTINNCTCNDNFATYGSGNGISVYYSEDNIIDSCRCDNNDAYGISTVDSPNTTIRDCSLSSNGYGNIYIRGSRGCRVLGNDMNEGGISLSGTSLPDYSTQFIDESNTVNGRKVRFIKDEMAPQIPYDAGQLILVNCSNALIKDRNLSRATVGLYLYGSNNITAENLTFEGNQDGVLAYVSNNLTIVSPKCLANENGVYIDSSENVAVLNGTFQRNVYGLTGYMAKNMTVSDCDFRNATIAYAPMGIYQGMDISIQGSHFVTLKDCLSEEGLDGISLSGDNFTVTNCTCLSYEENGISLMGLVDGTIEDCLCVSNKNGPNFDSVGLFLYDSDDNMIRDSLFGWNGLGVQLDGYSNRNTFHDNVIINNTQGGIDFMYYSSDNGNLFYYNNLINNNIMGGPQASDPWGYNIWNASGYGNYWSEWVTPDNDSDGIVDIPYSIGGSLSKDHYPLTRPHGMLRITTQNQETALEDEVYSVKYDAFSPNEGGNDLQWSFSTNATWLAFLPNDTLYGIPGNQDVGTYWVSISVTDGIFYDILNFSLEVVNFNDPPMIETYHIPDCSEDLMFYMDLDATDIDPTNDTLSWHLKSNASFLAIDGGTGVLSGLPDNDDVGSYWANVTVRDDKNGMSWTNFTLYVVNTNDPPEIKTKDVTACEEYTLYSVKYEAMDIDPTHDLLTWAVNTNAAFLSMDGNTGVLSGTPKGVDVGIYRVNVTVSDGNGGYDFTDFLLAVLNVQDPPEIKDRPGPITFPEDTIDTSLDLNTWFVDPFGEKLSFKCSVVNHLTVDIMGSGKVQLRPEANWSGSETVTFFAMDSMFEISDSVTVIVTPVNDAPYDPTIILQEGAYVEGGPQLVYGAAKDVDTVYGDKLNFTWYCDAKGLIGSDQYVNLSLPTGTYTITLRVKDLAGTQCMVSKNITILKDPANIGNVTDDDDAENSIYDYLIPAFLGLIIISTILLTVFLVYKKREDKKPKEHVKTNKRSRRVRVDKEQLDRYMSELPEVKTEELHDETEGSLYLRIPLPTEVVASEVPEDLVEAEKERLESGVLSEAEIPPSELPEAEDGLLEQKSEKKDPVLKE